ncbi:hypothetical protein T440DRAFT_390946 [Plenodomus tracheiphilus IPT5]|uniref:F-box domain-containing protein n=1 Tax=Plenodomus tracheiphilus IPT5 TaxID=1408161 RepID=A0A6A7BFA7_9PLEO|nr:hypothetical protein T440DRAFT_390946 [Plenodomus tracheiphilus IPT5]
MATLSALPNEILSLITSHLERPRDLLHLSLASRRLSEFAKLDGWKALLRGRFGVLGLDSDAQTSVHGLTTLYHNWDRRGFLAKYVVPPAKVTSLNDWRTATWRDPRGQTMGYQPSLDSYEEMYGGWNERREVLAWSAGTQIALRIRETGLNIDKIREAGDASTESQDQAMGYDTFGHLNSWYMYKVPESFEGRDDITSLKLLRTEQRDMAYETIIYGTASGDLTALSVSPDQEDTALKQYDTGGRAIGSIAISQSSSPMIAATLGDSSMAVYSVGRDTISDDPVEPLSQVTPVTSSSRIWSCNFLSDTTVMIGLGPCHRPIQVYEITPDGFSSTPLRSFDMDLNDRLYAGITVRQTCVYPTLPLPQDAHGGSRAGQTFLSGGYDGFIRLHDMRSPSSFEVMYWDPTNDASVYSLAAHGVERIVAGVSQHSMLKVFDLRLSGSHAYHTIKMPSNPVRKSEFQDIASNKIVDDARSNAIVMNGGWDLFMKPRSPPRNSTHLQDYWGGHLDSPVYSLSIPSPTSQNVYAGLEGIVQSLTFHSFTDKHPDPMLSSASGSTDDVLNLGMYDQGSGEVLGMQLLVQGDVWDVTGADPGRTTPSIKGLDERWKDVRDEGTRWARGDIPHRPARILGRRRGRGRGRGQ